MTPAPTNLASLFAELGNFQRNMGQVQAGLRNPEDKARLGDLLGQLQAARTDAENKVPGILQDKMKNAEKQKAELEALSVQVRAQQAEGEAKKRAEVEAKAPQAKPAPEPLAGTPAGVSPPKDEKGPAKPGVPAAAPPALPEVPIDPTLAAQLRVEVLRAYGGLIG
jgi:hypothetical protein